MNYHFGSKENLYVEAWKYSFERSIAAHPPDGGVAPEAPVGQRLRGRILAFMQRIGGPGQPRDRDHAQGNGEPDGTPYGEPFSRPSNRCVQDMRAIVQELLGDGASEQQVSFCEMSLMGQCFGPMLHLRHARMPPGSPRPPGPPSEFGVEELADHVTQFSLAGIRGIREGVRKRQKAGKRRRQGGSASRQE